MKRMCVELVFAPTREAREALRCIHRVRYVYIGLLRDRRSVRVDASVGSEAADKWTHASACPGGAWMMEAMAQRCGCGRGIVPGMYREGVRFKIAVAPVVLNREE